MLFASDWLIENPDTAIESFYYPTERLGSPTSTGFAAQVFADGPTQRSGATPQFLGVLISQAQKTLTISTPYFVPDYSLINVL